MNDILIGKSGLEITLCPPDMGTGYYRGTRFDHSGIFRRIVKDGFVLADTWFDGCDPYRHDTVCGNSEEFSECGYDDVSAGGVFLKPGVGLLGKEDDSAYDHFRLYEVADAGRWRVETADESATFVHVIGSGDWGYEYEKTVCIIDGSSYEITHRLLNTGSKTIEGQTYNHNFFTFGNARPGPDIEIDFPFIPCGDWRSINDSVALSGKGIRFSRILNEGEGSVFMGNLRPSDGTILPGVIFTQRAYGHEVTCVCDRPFDHIVFWSNHRVSCIEPFIPVRVLPKEEICWKYTYLLAD